MKRVFTATCLAATFAVGLAAQSTGTSGTAGTVTGQDPQPGAQRGGGPRTVTGCLRGGDTAGSYMLTDVIMQGGGGRRGGDATSTGASTTAGSTAGAGATGTGPESGGAMAPMSIMLNAVSDVDLKAHVGHKIEVTGTMAGGRGRGGDAAGSATGPGAPAPTGGQVTGRGGPRSMTVTSVRMISESCS
jgi:ribonuclease R